MPVCQGLALQRAKVPVGGPLEEGQLAEALTKGFTKLVHGNQSQRLPFQRLHDASLPRAGFAKGQKCRLGDLWKRVNLVAEAFSGAWQSEPKAAFPKAP